MGRKSIDLTGQQFGEWTVLRRSLKQTASKSTYWVCKCSCGTIKDICGSDLRLGRTTKCMQHNCSKKQGHHKTIKIKRKRNKFSDKCIGKKFGKLTVIKYDQTKADGTYVLCLCDCGTLISVRWNNLTSGRTQSCGCLKSKGEEKIAQILNKHKINFKREVSFPDLKGPNGGLLRFDFGIYNKEQLIQLIEFQGEFHYMAPPDGWTDVRISDKIKKEYCEKHKIPLKIISYQEFDEININTLFN